MDKLDKKILLYMVEELHFALIPVCVPINKENCIQHGSRCISPGKVPIISNWDKVDSVSPNTLQTWMQNPDDINFGLILGETKYNNLIGIDIDGDYGIEKLKELEDENGKLPNTIQYKTGNGMRYLFKLPANMESKKISFYESSKRERGEFAILCKGQQTIIPPSLHYTGFNYSWVEGRNPMEIELAEAPVWMIKMIRSGKGQSDGKNETKLILNLLEEKEKQKNSGITQKDFDKEESEGGRHNKMVRIVGSLVSNHKMPKDLVKTTAQVQNQKRFTPPLPEKEINTIVQSLWDAEESKMNDAKGRKENTLTPIFLAKKFLEDQAAKTIHWRYSQVQDCFYKYDTIDPPWRMISSIAIEQSIAGTVLRYSEKLVSKRTLNEVRYQLKIILLDTSRKDLFNLGKYNDNNKLFLQNGILDLTTMKLSPWKKEYITTIKLPVKWNPDAGKHLAFELWEETMMEWIADKNSVEFLQEFFGYSLTPDCKKRTALFLLGEGHNGKSLMLEILSELFGNHMSNLSLDKISKQFSTLELMNKLVNICADIDDDYITQTSMIKRIVAGEHLHGEIKYGASFDFVNTSKLIFSANKLPRASDTTKGWYSRWQIIKFPNSYEIDDNYYHKMTETFKSNEGKEALLYWAVQGLLRVRENVAFTHSEAMKNEKMDYMKANDSVVEFLMDCTESVKEKDASTRVSTVILYNMYSEWCSLAGVKSKSFRNFIDSVTGNDFKKKRAYIENDQRKTAFLGMELKDEADLVSIKPRTRYLIELGMKGGDL